MAKFGYDEGEYGGLDPTEFAGTTVVRVDTNDDDTLYIETTGPITGGTVIDVEFTANGTEYVLQTGERDGAGVFEATGPAGMSADIEAEEDNSLELLLTAVTPPPAPSLPQAANIIHHWKDDGFTGSGASLEWTDSIGSRLYKVYAFDNNAGNNLSVTQQNGIDVLDFGGTVAMKDYASSYLVGDDLPWTRAIIYKPDGVASNQVILMGQGALAERNASLRILSTGALNGVEVYATPTTVQSAVTAALHTDVVTCDGDASLATINSYYDGAAYDTTATVTTNPSNLGIGDLGHRGMSSGSDNYSGLVCEIIVWDVELTASEVSDLHDYLMDRFSP